MAYFSENVKIFIIQWFYSARFSYT